MTVTFLQSYGIFVNSKAKKQYSVNFFIFPFSFIWVTPHSSGEPTIEHQGSGHRPKSSMLPKLPKC